MTDSRPRISEEQARRLWERAAELQAEATRRREQEKGQSAGEALPGSTSGDNDEAGGYSLLHVREAGAEAGIQPEFVDMALAEETVLELEGGGGQTRLDRIATRLLRDGRPALEVRRSFAYPARAVWLTLEDVLRGEPNEFDLLELQGGSPVEGGIAIFESPKRHRESDALPYWSTAADTLRYLVAIRDEEDSRIPYPIFPRRSWSSWARSSSTWGYSRPREAREASTIPATVALMKGLSSAGTAYQGAQERDVALRVFS